MIYRIIKIYKLRTLTINSETNGPQWSSKNDNRITTTYDKYT